MGALQRAPAGQFVCIVTTTMRARVMISHGDIKQQPADGRDANVSPSGLSNDERCQTGAVPFGLLPFGVPFGRVSLVCCAGGGSSGGDGEPP
jgi:hypothetical protein